LFQIPAGALSDRFGTKKVLSIAIWLWVMLTILQGFAGWNALGFSVATVLILFMLIRFLLGITAAPTYPAAAAGISLWVPSLFKLAPMESSLAP
jgi:ACS family glucarate transporter-like MFS transporter